MARKGKKTQRDPFEVNLSDEQRNDLLLFIQRELDYAIMSRMAIVGDDAVLDNADLKYLGGDGSLTKDTPWPGAANLGSYLVTEKVDAMRARIMATVFTDPIWVVEGYGQSAQKAPIIEEFHQWKADQTKLHGYVGRAVHNSLIHGTGILEVNDRVVMRSSVRRMQAQIQVDHSTGAVILGPDANPIPVMTKDGGFVDAAPGAPHLMMDVKEYTRSTAGPQYRVVHMKDFYIMPGHAAETEDIWGYAKRVYRRLHELKQRQDDGFYSNVEALEGGYGERESPTFGVSQIPNLLQQGITIAPQQNERTAEKELWELTLLMDLDDDGYDEWYIVTYSHIHKTILRIQYEDYNTPHYMLFTPFPRPNSVWGFSYAEDKLGSLYDEHAALRNMYTDRMVLKTSAPILQLEGSLWNPAIRPFGPGKVLPVRQMEELKQMEVADVPNSVPKAQEEVLAAAERLSGMNDTTTGQLSQQDRTLGEVKLVTQQSWIRIDEVVKNLQQTMEDLFSLLNVIWKNKLQQKPEQWPGDITILAQQRSIDIGDDITADDLEGAYRGKPRGSVEDSDFTQMRVDIVQMITAINQLSQSVPALREALNAPPAVRSILTQIARVYRWPDRANLVGSFTGVAPPPPPPPPQGPPGVSGGTPNALPPGPPPQGGPPAGVPGISNAPA